MKRISGQSVLATVLSYRVVVALLLTIGISSFVVPSFFGERTFSLTLDQASTIGLIAVGLTVLLIAGQIDLSSGATLALSGIIAISLQPSLGALLGAVVGVAVGLAAGALNALLVIRFKIESLIATLATMLIVRAIAYWVSSSKPVAGVDIDASLAVTRSMLGIFTPRSLAFVLAVVVVQIWLSHTVAGRNLFAVGSNVSSAAASGVRTHRYMLGAFLFAGGMAGFAGVVQSLSINTGSPVLGDTVTVSVIAAVVIGGTRLEGGRGSAIGTLGGVLVIAFITTAMQFQNVPNYMQQIVVGSLLVLMVLLDQLTGARARAAIRPRRFVRRRPFTPS